MDWLKSGLALAVISALTACAPFGLSEPPEVSLVDLRPSEMALFEQRMAVMLRIRNPNDNALAVDGYRFAIELNGKPFARGISDQSVIVPRLSEATIEAAATVSTLDLVRQIIGVPERENLAYRISGTLFVSGGLMRNVPFENSGEVDFKAARGSR